MTTRSRYGTRLMLDLALHDSQGPVCISDVAERQNISVKYLEKIIHLLKSHGYITSKRGPRGGHVLAIPPEKISIGEIVRIMEGETALTKCVETGKTCEREVKCKMHGVWDGASKAMMDHLDAVSLSDLMD